MSLPPGAPVSPPFTVRDTPTSGRGVFALQDLPAETPLLASGPPAASVILREYRKEVCAQCFAYDCGREWKTRDAAVGFSFCSTDCEERWREEVGEDYEAWQTVEKLCKGLKDEEMDEADSPKPTRSEVSSAWKEAEKQANVIREGRTNPEAISKAHRKAIRSAVNAPPSSDILSFLLSGVICRTRSLASWNAILALANNPRPYRSILDLHNHIRSYLQLLAVLPTSLLPHTTAETCITLPARDSHNSFGIRSLEDDGSEFMGYAIWPSASYFNHSCVPNVKKHRVDKSWHFSTARIVEKGEELCITYQAGEDNATRGKRRSELKRNWGFDCQCAKCME